MTEIIVSIPEDSHHRLEVLAERLNKTVDDCMKIAMSEFLDHWEDYLATLAVLEKPEERPLLRAFSD